MCIYSYIHVYMTLICQYVARMHTHTHTRMYNAHTHIYIHTYMSVHAYKHVMLTYLHECMYCVWWLQAVLL